MEPADTQREHASQADNGAAASSEAPAAKHSTSNGNATADVSEEPPAKRARLDEPSTAGGQAANGAPERPRGTAPIKPEFLVVAPGSKQPVVHAHDDDAAEAFSHEEREGDKKKGKKREKHSGQNTGRRFGRMQDEKALCPTRMFHPEFSPAECSFGDNCRYEHDLRKYLKEYKREDLKTFNGVCPVWDARGKCPSGWKCRFVSSHMTERETEDGRRELVLVEDEERKAKAKPSVPGANEEGIVNAVSVEDKMALTKRRTQTPKADTFTAWIDKTSKELEKNVHGRYKDEKEAETTPAAGGENGEAKEQREEHRAQFTEPPFLPSEKRRIYFGPETPVLAPLTTQGNLPFRRLCVELGAQFTYSEMAMSMPLIQGSKSEWALMKAHESEMLPPTVDPKNVLVKEYDNSKDFKFGAQIAANKPWQALKATEVLTRLCPGLRVIDLNCGCPIDLVYREGAGSALLDHPSKLEKIVRGMNAVSDQVPITVKIRMGTKDNAPTALKLAERLTLGGYESSMLGVGPPGVAAITLHGRSRQQRYSRKADWGYISECAALVKRLSEKTDEVTDTIHEPDERTQPPGGKVYFLGNGDCYSHEDYFDHINSANVDSVMVARGALIKPWIFEEIQKGQYLDKSASERLSLVEKFARYGLDAWGSDEQGVGTTRRFLLEWLSFTHRYIPIGLLEYLPPNIQDRPPAYRGRNELETLLASDNYKDWIKITEMFLGPVHKDFKFEPKHKSNAYEVEAEG
ncbi:hypothetical protein VTN00DRAFT_9200 [Thermoascus crustaceus]|uniref:uncharacterized protein n=1 Tax=Thermoascus crustaceus TaxID=5088 RepID=UPI003743AFB0